MAKVPASAIRAVIGVQRAIAAMAATRCADRFAAADEHRLGGAAPLQARQVPVDELAVDEKAHEPMLDGACDRFAVAIG
jgi:hypothetical protein